MTPGLNPDPLRERLQLALHDLNTPLSILQNSLEPIEQSALGPEARAAVATLRREVARLMVVSEDLYLGLRASEPAIDSAAAPLDLNALVQEQIEILEEQHPTRSLGCRYLSGPAEVLADRSVLESLIWTVLTSLLLRTESDVLVTLTRRPDPAVVVLTVCDEGPALEPGQAETLLAGPRASARRAGAARSLDPGLSAARTLLHRMGGDIRVTRARQAERDVNQIELQLACAAEAAA